MIYDMKNQFWARLGSRASVVKNKFGLIMSNFRGQFFMFSWAKNKSNFFLKSCIEGKAK